MPTSEWLLPPRHTLIAPLDSLRTFIAATSPKCSCHSSRHVPSFALCSSFSPCRPSLVRLLLARSIPQPNMRADVTCSSSSCQSNICSTCCTTACTSSNSVQQGGLCIPSASTCSTGFTQKLYITSGYFLFFPYTNYVQNSAGMSVTNIVFCARSLMIISSYSIIHFLLNTANNCAAYSATDCSLCTACSNGYSLLAAGNCATGLYSSYSELSPSSTS